jgi:transcriptional regulator with XRE-family HTH domain
MINRVLKLTRQYHRLTQADLAARLGISKSFLSELEAEKKAPTLDLIGRYAREFKLPASTFLMFSERLDGAPASGSKAHADKLLRFLEWAASEEDEERATT